MVLVVVDFPKSEGGTLVGTRAMGDAVVASLLGKSTTTKTITKS